MSVPPVIGFESEAEPQEPETLAERAQRLLRENETLAERAARLLRESEASPSPTTTQPQAIKQPRKSGRVIPIPDDRPFDNVLTRSLDSPTAISEAAKAARDSAEASSIPATPTAPVVIRPEWDPTKQGSPFDQTPAAPTHGASATWGDELGPIEKARADAKKVFREKLGPDLTERLGTVAQDQSRNSVTRGAAMIGGMVTGAIEHPVETAEMLVTAPINSADVLSRYLYQQAADAMGVTTEWIDAGGQPVTAKEAAFAVAQLGALGFAGKIEQAIAKKLSEEITARAAAGLPTAGMGRGAAILSRARTGAIIGAAYAPDDPLAGGIAGAVGGGLHAGLTGERVAAPSPERAPTERQVVGAPAPDARVGVELPLPPKGRVRTEEMPPESTEADYTVEMNAPPKRATPSVATIPETGATNVSSAAGPTAGPEFSAATPVGAEPASRRAAPTAPEGERPVVLPQSADAQKRPSAGVTLADRPAVEGPSGHQSETRFSDNTAIQTQYRVVDASSLVPSHNPMTFDRHPSYPEGVQGREYAGTRGEAARAHVIAQTAKLNPSVVLDLGSGITDGPPLVTPHGIAVAGNQRSMQIMRAYGMGELAAQRYRDALDAVAPRVGIDPASFKDMKSPVLVRQITDPNIDVNDPRVLGQLNQLSDQTPTKAKDVLSAAAGRATAMRQAGTALAHFGETIGADDTIREYLGSAAGGSFVRKLFEDGVISPQERAAFIDASGNVTPSGKESIEAMMKVAAIGNPDVIHRAPPSILRKMEHAIPAIIHANAHPQFSLEKDLQHALDLLSRVEATKAQLQAAGQKVGGYGVEDFLQQQDMFGGNEVPMHVGALATVLERATKKDLSDGLREYAKGAAAATRAGQSDDIFGVEPETRAQLGHRTLGVSLGDEPPPSVASAPKPKPPAPTPSGPEGDSPSTYAEEKSRGRGLTDDEELAGRMTDDGAEQKRAFRNYSKWRREQDAAVRRGDDVATFDEWLVDVGGETYARDILGREPVLREKRPAERVEPKSDRETAGPEPEALSAASNPVRASVDDIPYDRAIDAYRWNSMSPERRANDVRTGYVEHIQNVYDNLKPLATTPELQDLLASEIERYRQGYLKRELALLAATSRTANPMVTGPARFPVERNRKAMEREAKLRSELLDWSKRAQSAMHDALAPAESRAVSSDNPDAIDILQKKVDAARALQERMKAANKIIMKTAGQPVDERVAKLVALGFDEKQARDAIVPPFQGAGQGFPSYRLQNNLAEVKRLEARIAELTRRRAQTSRELPFDGGRVVESVEDNRLQIFFDAKPDRAMVDKLKARGFRWAPSVGAWQRQLTENAKIAARGILGIAATQAGAVDGRVSERIKRYSARRPREIPLPEEAAHITSGVYDAATYKEHPEYAAAKAGDAHAAVRFVEAQVRPESVEEARRAFGADVKYLPPIAEEHTGANAIPTTLASYYAAHAGGSVAPGIVQTTRSGHTGADMMERLVSPVAFSGPIERGQRYVLVDDVLTSGGTIAALADYVQRQGGVVAGVVTLADASRSRELAPEAKTVALLERRLGDAIRHEFGIEPRALTRDEAQYLVGFRTADELRTRAATARAAAATRRRERGVPPKDIGHVSEPLATYGTADTRSRSVAGERVVAAAVRLPNGEIARGPSHFLALTEARERGAVRDDWYPDFDRDDGWLTSEGRFVDRREGYRIAERADQLRRKSPERELYHVDAQLPRGVAESGEPYRSRFYSRLERAIQTAPHEKATGAQWLSALSKNVSKGEREWTGLEEYLNRRRDEVLTRDAVQGMYDQGKIELDDAIAGDTPEHKRARTEASERVRLARAEVHRALDTAGGRNDLQLHSLVDRVGSGALVSQDLVDALKERSMNHAAMTPQNIQRLRDAAADFRDAVHARDQALSSRTRYDDYTLPGEETNYREIKITLRDDGSREMPPGYSVYQDDDGTWGVQYPNGQRISGWRTRESAIESQKNQPGNPQFRTTHFDEPNILAHTRVDDRTLPNGERALFVEEIQSDWHQQGREKGYRNEKVALTPEERREFNELRDRYVKAPPVGDATPLTDDELARMKELDKRMAASTTGVPDAPFKKTEEWVGLVLRRLIDEAVHGGYDRIAWTTGAQQAARYDLSKYVDTIDWQRGESGAITYTAKKDNRLVAMQRGADAVKPDELADHLGKDIARQILDDPDDHGSITGNDLRVGGHGMVAFYDTILPTIVRGYAKKLGIRLDVETVPLSKRHDDFVSEKDRLAYLRHRSDLSPIARAAIESIADMAEKESLSLGTATRYVVDAWSDPATLPQFPEGMEWSDAARDEVVRAIKASETEAAQRPADEVHSFAITPELRAKVEKDGQFVMERGRTYDPDQLDAFTVSTDGGAPKPITDSPDEHTVASTPAQRAVARQMLRRFRERLARLGVAHADDRRTEVAAANTRDLIDPVGMPLSSAYDAALLMVAFRHPAMEVFHAFATRDGKVVGHLALTSGMLGQARVADVSEIVALVRRTDADAVTFGHNHPSGDPTPSFSDYRVTHSLARELFQHDVFVDGHVVINHDEASYFTVDTDRHTAQNVRVSIPESAQQLAAAPWKTAIERNATLITSPDKSAEYLAAVADPRSSVLLYVDSQHRAIGVAPLLTSDLASMHTWLDDAMTAHGARKVIVGIPMGQDPRGFAQSVGLAQGLEEHRWATHILDVIGLTIDPKTPTSRHVSYADLGIVNPSSERDVTDEELGRATVRLRHGRPVREQVDESRRLDQLYEADTRRRRSGTAEEAGRLPDDDRVSERDLFGNESDDRENQSSLFARGEGTAKARDLKATERAARAELEQLRQRDALTTSPVEKVKIARRMSELEKLVNRDKAITADEMRTRAVAGESENLFGGVREDEDGRYTPRTPDQIAIDREISLSRPRERVLKETEQRLLGYLDDKSLSKAQRASHERHLESVRRQLYPDKFLSGERVREERPEYRRELTSDALQKWASAVEQRLGLDRFDVSLTRQGNIELDVMVVPKSVRNQGVGSAAIRELTSFADQHGRRIVLNPADRGDLDGEGTTSRGRLVRFYQRFGFVRNAGRHREFRISNTMYRDPNGGSVREETPEYGGDGDPTPETLFSPAAPGTPLSAKFAKMMGRGRQNAAAVDEVNSLATISRNLAKMVGVPLRQGRFLAGQRQAVGAFFTHSEVARLVRFDKLDTAAHEIGHYISKKYLRNPTMKGGAARGGAPGMTREMIRELVKMGRDLYGNRKPAGGYGEEGIAQWARFYVTDPARLQTDAPKFSAWMESTILTGETALKQALDQAQQDFDDYTRAPYAARIDAMIDVNPSRRFLPDTRRLATAILDDLNEIRLAVEALGTSRSAEDDAYTLARLTRGVAGAAEEMIERGIVDAKGNRVTKGVADVFAQLRPEDVQPFRRYLIAERTLEVAGRGIDTGISLADARAAVADLEKRFRRLAEELWRISNALIDYRRDKGLLTDDEATEIKKNNSRRVGFYRVFDESETSKGMSRGSGKGFGRNSSGLQKMRGSSRDIIDPLESVITDIYKTVKQARAAEVLRALVEHAESTEGGGRVVEVLAEAPQHVVRIPVEQIEDQLAQLGFQVPNGGLGSLGGVVEAFQDAATAGPRETKDLVRPLIIDGERKWIQINDAQLFDALSGLGTPEIPKALRLASVPTRLLRAGATLTLEFIGRNPVRDAVDAAIFTRAGGVHQVPGASLTRGLFHLAKRDELYQQWRLAGGDNAAMLGLDRHDVQKHVRQLLRRPAAARAAGWVLHPIDALRMLSSISENATRLGEFAGVRANAIARGATAEEANAEAGLASRDVTLDFARAGTQVRVVNQFVAFFNANVQGFDKIQRELRARPGSVLPRILAWITLPSILLYLAQKDDEDYKEVPAWQKAIAWVIVRRDRNGKLLHIWRIPKPPEIGTLFGSVPERIAEWIHTQDPHALSALWDSLGNLSPLHSPYIPNALVPVVEWLANKDFFRDRPIVPEGAKNLPAGEQTSSRTGEAARLVGGAINVSPAKLEHTIVGYTSGLGQYGLGLANAAVREWRTLANEPPLPRAPESAGDRLASLPFVKGFTIRKPGLDAESVQRALAQFDRAEAYRQGWHRRLKAGDTAAANAYYREHEADIISVATRTDRIPARVGQSVGLLKEAHDLIVDAQRLSRNADSILRERVTSAALNVAQRALASERPDPQDRLFLSGLARAMDRQNRAALRSGAPQ